MSEQDQLKVQTRIETAKQHLYNHPVLSVLFREHGAVIRDIQLITKKEFS